MKVSACELCERAESPAWIEIFRDSRLRVLRVLDTPDFPAFYRVVWVDHVAELSDLAPDDRAHCLEAVVAVERALREVLAPTKINLASLGNMVPHLHWHVIARFDWDSHFPGPIWAARQRDPQPAASARIGGLLNKLDDAVRRGIAGLSDGLGSI